MSCLDRVMRTEARLIDQSPKYDHFTKYIITIITEIVYSALVRLSTQKCSQPQSNVTVLRAERKEME